MPSRKRQSTRYAGVVYVEAPALHAGGKERIYFIRYKRPGSSKLIEERLGRAAEGWTAAKARHERSLRILGKKPSNEERRERARAEKMRPSFKRLMKLYAETSTSRYIKGDLNRFERYLAGSLGDKTPEEVTNLDFDRIRLRLLKRGLSPQTVKHALSLALRLARFGVDRGLCAPLGFRPRLPRLDNEKVETLPPETLSRLVKVLREHENRNVSDALLLALYTGMRRGELFSLTWGDVDLDAGAVTLRHPKSGRTQRLPLNSAAVDLLRRRRPRGAAAENPVFESTHHGEGRRGLLRRDKAALEAIKRAAALPEGFRPFHGLRHVHASLLAGAGVPLYTVQRLLTHHSPTMTARYSHLADSALREASERLVNLIEEHARPPRAPRRAGKGA